MAPARRPAAVGRRARAPAPGRRRRLPRLLARAHQPPGPARPDGVALPDVRAAVPGALPAGQGPPAGERRAGRGRAPDRRLGQHEPPRLVHRCRRDAQRGGEPDGQERRGHDAPRADARGAREGAPSAPRRRGLPHALVPVRREHGGRPRPGLPVGPRARNAPRRRPAASPEQRARAARDRHRARLRRPLHRRRSRVRGGQRGARRRPPGAHGRGRRHAPRAQPLGRAGRGSAQRARGRSGRDLRARARARGGILRSRAGGAGGARERGGRRSAHRRHRGGRARGARRPGGPGRPLGLEQRRGQRAPLPPLGAPVAGRAHARRQRRRRHRPGGAREDPRALRRRLPALRVPLPAGAPPARRRAHRGADLPDVRHAGFPPGGDAGAAAPRARADGAPRAPGRLRRDPDRGPEPLRGLAGSGARRGVRAVAVRVRRARRRGRLPGGRVREPQGPGRDRDREAPARRARRYRSARAGGVDRDREQADAGEPWQPARGRAPAPRRRDQPPAVGGSRRPAGLLLVLPGRARQAGRAGAAAPPALQPERRRGARADPGHRLLSLGRTLFLATDSTHRWLYHYGPSTTSSASGATRSAGWRSGA